jgi:hypothetical protein
MRGAVHMQITTIGLDIAKNVFQVSRDRQQREDCCSEAAAAQPNTSVLQSVVALPDRHRGVRHGPLLGARTDEALVTGCG